MASIINYSNPKNDSEMRDSEMRDSKPKNDSEIRDSNPKNDSEMRESNPKCVHKYLTKCLTNPQPPGFADFLRGTIALYNFSKKYDYQLFVDGSHPVFTFLKSNKNIILTDLNIHEFLPPLSYNHIHTLLDKMFNKGQSFGVMTNSFYTLKNGILENYGPITEDCRDYLKDILSPTLEVENKMKEVLDMYNLTNYKVIHLRFGDIFLNEDEYDEDRYKLYYNKIIELKHDKYVLLSDSSIIANKLKKEINELGTNNTIDLYYWDNNKIHLGDLKNKKSNNSNILDTMVDFFIMSKSTEIIANGSGFSKISSIIYDIPYTNI